MNVWPATLPQKMDVSGFQEGMGDGRVRTQNETGPTKDRRRLSAVPRPLTATMTMTEAQVGILETFIRVTQAGGVLPFQMPGQRGGGTWVVKLAQNMPAFVPLGGVWWRVSLDLVIMP